MILFDGKADAEKVNKDTRYKVQQLKKGRVIPKLVSILVGDDPGSVLYLNLKRKSAEEVGVVLEIMKFQGSESVNQLIGEINKLNEDKSVNSIMIQLPLPTNFSKLDRDEIINSIAPEKDVDGLRDDSPFTAPVVRAVLAALNQGLVQYTKYNILNTKLHIVVVGAKGFEGRKIEKELRILNIELWDERLEITGLDRKSADFYEKIKSADVIISATGNPGIIKADMVKDNVILIDVGAPKGDIERAAYEKASFVSADRGGIGPVTISYLMENLVLMKK